MAAFLSSISGRSANSFALNQPGCGFAFFGRVCRAASFMVMFSTLQIGLSTLKLDTTSSQNVWQYPQYLLMNNQAGEASVAHLYDA